ncbi:MAG: DUF3298 and DUF4163 domain-containing protein [Bacteroidota bacterium]
MWKLFAISSVICILLCTCQEETVETSNLPYHFVEFVQYSPECAVDSMKCAVFKAAYPNFDSADAAVKSQINNSIMDYVLKLLSDQPKFYPQTLQELANDFFKDYKEFSFGGFDMPWELDCSSEVTYSNQVLFSVSLNSYRFTGGAHPNTLTAMFNFELDKGKLLSVEDIVLDYGSFKNIAEEVFRFEKQIESDVPLQEAGFFIESFQLSTNFAFTQEGIKLYYNPYEIAPYAAGITEIVIPYSRLEGILKSRYLPKIS